MQRLSTGGALMSDRTTRALALAVAIYCVAWIIASMLLRGPWIDEYWTVWATQATTDLTQAFRERWIVDVHPPLYYGLNWLFGQIVGDGVITRRLLNGLILALACLASVTVARRDAELRVFAIVFGIGLLSVSPVLAYLSEARSNLLQIAAAALLAVSLYAQATLGRDVNRADRVLVLVLGGACLVAFNVHYIATLICGIAMAIFVLDALRRNRPRAAAVLFLAAAIATLPLLAYGLAQRALIGESVGSFWISTGPFEGLRVALGQTLRGVFGNPVIGIAAVVAVVGVMRRGSRRASSDLPWAFAAPMAVAIILALGVLVTVNIRRPIIIDRYLVAAAVFALGTAAALATPLFRRHTRVFAAALAASAIAATWHCLGYARQPRWDATAALAAHAVSTCPTSSVLAVEPGVGAFPNVASVFDYGYRQEASRFGFTVSTVPQGSSPTLPPPAACPALVWVEHHDPANVPNVAAAAAVARLPPTDPRLARAELKPGTTGFVLVLP